MKFNTCPILDKLNYKERFLGYQEAALNHVKCNREGACSIMENVTQFLLEVGLHGKDGHELPKTISQGVDGSVCENRPTRQGVAFGRVL